VIAPGTVLGGKYVVERVLGEGGMGMVVAATHKSLGHKVAIKMMLPQAAAHPEMLARFEREARAAAGLSSEHAARVTDVGHFDDGMPYMVMEFLEGEDLEHGIARQKQLPIADVIRYYIQSCIGLHDAHTAGIVHRDVKPSNIFLARRPSGRVVVKILDFGIAKAAVSMTDPSLTRTTAMMGSPLYMSPEQLANAKGVDHRTDVWSLGAAFYEAVCGQPAFPADTLALLHAMILTQEPVRPSRLRRDIPPELEMVLLTSLEKDPAKRYSSMQAVQRELERLEQRLAGMRPLVDSDPAHMVTAMPATVEAPVFSETMGSAPRRSVAPPAQAPVVASAFASPLSGTAAPTSQTYGDAPVRRRARSAAVVVVAGLALLGAVAFGVTRALTPAPVEPARAAAAPAAPAPTPSDAPVHTEPAPLVERVAEPPAPRAPEPSGETKRGAARPRAKAAPAAPAPLAPAVVAPAPEPAPPAAEKPKKKKRHSLEPEVEE
jgi:serine/threonine-protein kinase